jgi:hypothetical protein
MGDLVLGNMNEGKWDRGLLGRVLLKGELINEKLILKSTFQYCIIPLFQVQGKNSGLKKFR